MYHMFNVEDAEKYGIACALMLNYLQHWILHNKANGTNYFDGRYWTFNSSAALHEQFPELSERQIRTALNKLVDAGLIMRSGLRLSISALPASMPGAATWALP